MEDLIDTNRGELIRLRGIQTRLNGLLLRIGNAEIGVPCLEVASKEEVISIKGNLDELKEEKENIFQSIDLMLKELETYI